MEAHPHFCSPKTLLHLVNPDDVSATSERAGQTDRQARVDGQGWESIVLLQRITVCFPGPTLGLSQLPVPVSGSLMASSGLCGHLYAYSTQRQVAMHIDINKNKKFKGNY